MKQNEITTAVEVNETTTKPTTSAKVAKVTLNSVETRQLIDREAIKALPTAYRSNATEFAKAYELSEASAGIQAYYMHEIYKTLATVGNEKPDGIKSIADFGEKYFGIGRSQSFNLAKAGSFIRLEPIYKAETNDICGYTSNDIWGQNFTNTALIRIAEYIGNGETANARRTEVDEKIRLNLINGKMSISQLKEALQKTIIDGKLADKPKTENGTDKDGAGNDKKGNATNKKTEKTVTFEMTEKKALDLKTELLKAIGSKYKEYPVIAEIINSMNNQFKANKK